MSIIHDALKKVQQGLSGKNNETPTAPLTDAKPSSSYIYSAPPEASVPTAEKPIEVLPSSQNNAKSFLAMLCAIAISIACIAFFFKQLNTYFPQLQPTLKNAFYKYILRKDEFGFKNERDLVPLAKIIVNPPAAPAPTPAPTMPAVAPTTPALIPTAVASAATVPAVTPTPIPPVGTPVTPETLNVHGVMSNGNQNLVLIDDQVYQEGDEVDGVKILKIGLTSITVLNNGQEEKIRVRN